MNLSGPAKRMTIFVGERVDVVMDGPPNSSTEVISIIKHPGS